MPHILTILSTDRLVIMSLFLLSTALSLPVGAAPVVPGTGHYLEKVGDTFEDETWSFKHHFPKSSEEIDGQTRSPVGRSKNGRWFEGMKRGQPDDIRRVITPPGGLEGSGYSLLLRSLRTGIPHAPSYRLQQDDFICNVVSRLKSKIPVSQTPNFTVRVFMPPVNEWERRRGPTFAIRAACETSTYGVFASSQTEPYWPGMFINFRPKRTSSKKAKTKKPSANDYDTAFLSIRGNKRGQTFKGPAITETGWWTFGMSFTPDGMVHFYASPGVDDLTEDDLITSQYPYGFRCERFRTFFFNVCNGDNGKTWSTSWVIDDPALYVVEPNTRLRQAKSNQTQTSTNR